MVAEREGKKIEGRHGPGKGPSFTESNRKVLKGKNKSQSRLGFGTEDGEKGKL